MHQIFIYSEHVCKTASNNFSVETWRGGGGDEQFVPKVISFASNFLCSPQSFKILISELPFLSSQLKILFLPDPAVNTLRSPLLMTSHTITMVMTESSLPVHCMLISEVNSEYKKMSLVKQTNLRH